MFMLADANNFYASCERVFRPDLHDKPIAVLSNNDGCVIARSAECKALGIGMGEPFFACRQRFAHHQIQVFSANFPLYGDMSNRLMQLLLEHSGCPLEVYSIDEAFMDIGMLDAPNSYSLAVDLTDKALRWLGLPISIGIGHTKTLAKLANHLAKQRGAPVLLDTPKQQQTALHHTHIADIWGIGKRMCFRLQRAGIHNAAEFAAFDAHWVRQEFGVYGERLQLELNAVPCAFIEDYAPKKHIQVSRSFGHKVTCKAELYEAITHFCVRAAEKLRAQGSVTSAVHTMLYTTSAGHVQGLSYHSGMRGLKRATNDPRELAALACACVDELFIPHARYAKAGVVLRALTAEGANADLFCTPNTRSTALWRTIDAINHRYGQHTMRLAIEAPPNATQTQRNWHMNQNHRSPHYTTQWNELMHVKAS